MIRRSPLLLLLFLLPVRFAAASGNQLAGGASATSAYEVLRQHGLPSGLLPKGVRDFQLDEDGRFEVHLEAGCTAKFETEVYYDRNITCKLSYGQITSISGVCAHELFLWFPVRVIRVDIPSSGLIYFDVGVIYKQFSLSLFETPPDCSPAAPSPTREGHHIAQIASKSQFGKLPQHGLDRSSAESSAGAI